MVYSFACFLYWKFIANILMTRFNAEKKSYYLLGDWGVVPDLCCVYSGFTAVYAAVMVSIFVWTLLGNHLCRYFDTVDNEHTKWLGRSLRDVRLSVLRVVPAVQGYVAEYAALI